VHEVDAELEAAAQGGQRLRARDHAQLQVPKPTRDTISPVRPSRRYSIMPRSPSGRREHLRYDCNDSRATRDWEWATRHRARQCPSYRSRRCVPAGPSLDEALRLYVGHLGFHVTWQGRTWPGSSATASPST
jgi:hypothetical protein